MLSDKAFDWKHKNLMKLCAGSLVELVWLKEDIHLKENTLLEASRKVLGEYSITVFRN